MSDITALAEAVGVMHDPAAWDRPIGYQPTTPARPHLTVVAETTEHSECDGCLLTLCDCPADPCPDTGPRACTHGMDLCHHCTSECWECRVDQTFDDDNWEWRHGK